MLPWCLLDPCADDSRGRHRRCSRDGDAQHSASRTAGATAAAAAAAGTAVSDGRWNRQSSAVCNRAKERKKKKGKKRDEIVALHTLPNTRVKTLIDRSSEMRASHPWAHSFPPGVQKRRRPRQRRRQQRDARRRRGGKLWRIRLALGARNTRMQPRQWAPGRL